MITTLRPDQERAIEMVRQSLREGKNRPMMQAPTGYGKTKVAAAIASNVIARDKRAIFTVPRISLVDQTVMSFWREGISDVGVIQGQHEMTNWGKPIQVCSVQTLQRRTVPDADVVMIDEAHEWFKFYGKWMLDPEWMRKPFCGLSATPWTRGLGRYYNNLLVAATTQQLIDEGHLSSFKVYVPSHPDLKQVRTVAGDYHEGELSDTMSAGSLVADIVQTWMKLGKGRPTLCFAVDRAHAKKMQAQFTAVGVRTDYIDYMTSLNEREAVKNRFHRGETEIVFNVECLTTGVDWDVRCIILARPTKSEILFVQMIGRGLRTANGKDHCLILDHSDTHLRLGFVTDIHHDVLDEGKERVAGKEKKIALPKECPQCAFLKPPRTAVCPACQFVCTAHSRIETEDGELKEFKGKKKVPTEDKIRFMAQLKWIVRERGYKNGWAANQYRQKFGVWPRSDPAPMPPTPEVINWVKSRQIAYAKSRGK